MTSWSFWKLVKIRNENKEDTHLGTGPSVPCVVGERKKLLTAEAESSKCLGRGRQRFPDGDTGSTHLNVLEVHERPDRSSGQEPPVAPHNLLLTCPTDTREQRPHQEWEQFLRTSRSSNCRRSDLIKANELVCLEVLCKKY